MKRNILTLCALALCLATTVGCSKSDDPTDPDETKVSPTTLYAIVKEEGAQQIDITPSDYVLTLDNIIAADPDRGKFILKDTPEINAKAYPPPTQYCILFYSEGQLLFEAKLNSVISSYLPSGITFCHMITNKAGISWYNIDIVSANHPDGIVVGGLTEQEEVGIEKLFDILRRAGKIQRDLEFDFDL